MKATARTISMVLILLIGLCVVPSYASPKLESLCQFHYPTDYLYEWDCVQITRRDSPYRLFGKYWQEGLRFNRLDRLHFVAGLRIKVPRHPEDLKDFNPMPPYYLDAEREPQFILIDQNEMYLGAYEYGRLVLSAPVAVGREGYRLQNGDYRVDAFDRLHESSLYPVDGTDRPYPMHYGLRFHIDRRDDGWTSYWIHGRDLPGYPASHGCIGLYDEEMQREYYGAPETPLLMDAQRLYEWVVGNRLENGGIQNMKDGPRVLIMGMPPEWVDE